MTKHNLIHSSVLYTAIVILNEGDTQLAYTNASMKLMNTSILVSGRLKNSTIRMVDL